MQEASGSGARGVGGTPHSVALAYARREAAAAAAADDAQACPGALPSCKHHRLPTCMLAFSSTQMACCEPTMMPLLVMVAPWSAIGSLHRERR